MITRWEVEAVMGSWGPRLRTLVEGAVQPQIRVQLQSPQDGHPQQSPGNLVNWTGIRGTPVEEAQLAALKEGLSNLRGAVRRDLRYIPFDCRGAPKDLAQGLLD